MESVKKILVPTDFSDCSEEALDYGMFLAGQLNATLLLAHVMELMVYPIDFTLADRLAYPELKKEIGEELEMSANRWRGKGVQIETHLFKGDPASQIVKAAKDLECDLIIMGTHGRRGIPRALMGSVAEQVIRSSSIPVLTVRPPKEAKRTEKEKELQKATASVA